MYGNERKIPINVCKKLPFKDKTFDFVFTEHLIEHLYYKDALKFLIESNRILKDDGTIRISVPDLDFLLKMFTKERTTTQNKYLKDYINKHLKIQTYNPETLLLNDFVRNFYHKFIYNFNTLKEILEKAGFKEIKRVKVGESTNPNLSEIESHWGEIGKNSMSLRVLL